MRVSTQAECVPEATGREAFLAARADVSLPIGFRVYLLPERIARNVGTPHPHHRVCILPHSMDYLAYGDIVRVSPAAGHISVLYRRNSASNSMLLTERCNSFCIMCSQPPKLSDDSYLVDAYLEAIPLMSPDTAELGITGGEPTLLGQRLFDLLAACKAHLPCTAIHMLTNGRMFNYLSLAEELARIDHPNLVLGIPVYSDIASKHDFVVQAAGAFDQTIRGIMNLERCGVRIEVRVVLHRHTIGRLPQLARFLARNLPFVEHVALMGLEPMGFARANLEAIWVDPIDYQPALRSAVDVLSRAGMNVSIYNHQLCTLPEELWPYARKSISDWKNEFFETCSECAVNEACGGFFASAAIRRSEHIHPIAAK